MPEQLLTESMYPTCPPKSRTRMAGIEFTEKLLSQARGGNRDAERFEKGIK